MAKSNCIIVRVAGRHSDNLRLEASRIAKNSQVDWWVERTEQGSRFCFEGADAKQMFASVCDNFGVVHQDG